MMNILFTTHQGDLAGSTFSIGYLAKGLAARGHQIHVACRPASLLWEHLRRVEHVTCHEVSFSNYLHWQSVYRVAQIVGECQIQVINAQGGRDRNLTILAKWLFQLSCKIVFTRRQRPRNEPWLKRWLHIRGTAKMVMISNGLKEIFLDRGYPEDHLKVIFNGVPADIRKSVQRDSSELRRQLGLLDQKVVGCLSRKKIQEEIIRALKFVNEDFVVLFVGIHRHELDEVIREEQPKQQLIFTGRVSHEVAMQYLHLVDINVLASHIDGFGLALVESMLLEVPVIGSDFGGIRDVIRDGENGYLFANGNPQELATKIDRLLTNNLLRQQFIKNGLRDAQTRFSIERTVNEYEQFFEELIPGSEAG